MLKQIVYFIFFFLNGLMLFGQHPAGKYRPGFMSFNEYDYTRSFKGLNENKFKPRPIQICVWYPSAGKQLNRMRIMDYCNLYPLQFDFVNKSDSAKKANILTWKGVFSDKGVINPDSVLKLKTNAISGAPAASGNFPVVIYIPGAGGEAFENYLLAECLASNGFIVISCPSFGPDDAGISVNQRGIESQVNDINFLYGYISKIKNADKTNVSLMGFSMGGLTNLIYAMRKQELFNSVISIDGSIRTWYSTAIKTPGFSAERFQTPFLLLASNGDNWTDTLFINKTKFADCYLAKIDSFQHLDFTSYNYYANGAVKRGIYESACTLVLNYLLQVTKDEQVSIEKYASSNIRIVKKNGLAVKLISEKQFLQMIEVKGIEATKEYYYLVKKIDAGLQLFDEDELITLAFNYFNARKKPAEAIEIAKLVTDAFPASYIAMARLARLYEKNKKPEQALHWYSQALLTAEKLSIKSPSVVEDIEYYKKRIKQ